MAKSLKSILLAVSGFVGLLGLALVILLIIVDTNSYKPKLEAAASRILGMEVRVGGRLSTSFSPGLLVTMEDVHLRNVGRDVASAKEASLGIDLLPLFRKEVQIGKIALKDLRINIERDSDGKFNFERPETTRGTLIALDLEKVSFSAGTLLYADKQSGDAFEAADCSLDAHRLRLFSRNSSDIMRNLSFTAELTCGEIRKKDFTVSDLKASTEAKNGVFDLKPVTMRVFGAQGSGSIRADFSGTVPFYNVHYSLPLFHIEEFFKTLSPQKVVEGTMDFSANLLMQGKTENEMKQTAHGEFSLRGENLTLKGHDLDREFSRFESSQNFNLVDVGAFFFAGPIGLAVTKGYNFASIIQGAEGRSEIRKLVSNWKVEHGMAQAQDVAMATNENRVALRGGLDFVNERFDEVTVALIDAKGCVKVRQKISGTFQEPVVEKPNVLMSLGGPALRLLKKAKDLFPGGECEVFYAGSVTPRKED